MTPDTLKTWRARLGLGEHGMAAYVGVPLFTWRKWENGTRTPDAAPLRLLALLQRLETDAPAIHAELLQDAQKQPQDAPKRQGKGKGASGAEKRDGGAPDAPAAPDPWGTVVPGLPKWLL